jgi:hypothetical protein
MSTTVEKITTEKEAIEFVKDNAWHLADVPMHLRTAAVVKTAVSKSSSDGIILSVPRELRTLEMVLNVSGIYSINEYREFFSRVNNSDWGIATSGLIALVKKGEIPNLSKVSDEKVLLAVYKKAVSKEISNFRKVPKEIAEKIVTKELAMSLVCETGRNTFYGVDNFIKLPESLQNDEKVLSKLQEMFIHNIKNVSSFHGLKPEHITLDMCKALVEQHPRSLNEVPDEMKTQEICEIAVKKDGSALKYVPSEMKAGFYREVAKTGSGLDGIPEEDRTDAICTIAVEKNPMQLQFVPEDKKSYALCLTAVDGDAEAIDFVPKNKIDEEMVARFITAVMTGKYKRDDSLTDEYRSRSSYGKKAIVQEVFDTFLSDCTTTSDKRDKLGEVLSVVIEREPKLYFNLHKVCTNEEDYNSRKFYPFFLRAITFEHAVIAAKKDISIVGGFPLEVQKEVWRFYIQNNKD